MHFAMDWVSVIWDRIYKNIINDRQLNLKVYPCENIYNVTLFSKYSEIPAK